MGKYNHLASTLIAKPEVHSYQEKVDRAKDQIEATTQIELVRQLLIVRKEKVEAKETLSEIQIRLKAIEQMLINGFESVGITNLKLESGESISTQMKPWSKVDDKRLFRSWCVANGYEDLLELPWQTMNGLVCHRLEEGMPEPDGVSAFIETRVVVRGSKK